jgi:hypothetical protein
VTLKRSSAIVLLAVLLAACSPSVSPAPSLAPVLSAAPTASPAALPSAGTSPGASPAVPIDPTLLAILPLTVDGQTITEVPEVEANLVTDPNLIANASGLAVALGIDVGSGQFAYIAVIQLKPLVFGNAFYLSWRQSYDEGACSQSNGLKSTGRTTIAGRQVFTGTCLGGADTYHVHLVAPDRLVSITSVGTSHYGALVLAALKP